MHIEHLNIEMTRRCTLACEHCFRGDAQNINISEETLYNVFSNVKEIDRLLLTGGEPLLAVNELEKTIELIKNNNIKIRQINLVTNGTVLSSRILKILKELSQISHLNLKISFDIFHLLELEKRNLREKRDGNVKFLKENFGAKEYGDENEYEAWTIKPDYQGLQPIGRAKKINLERLNEINSLVLVKYKIYPFVSWIEQIPKFEVDKLCGDISIDVNGNVVSYGLSFEEEDIEAKITQNNINNLSFEQAINNFVLAKGSNGEENTSKKK